MIGLIIGVIVGVIITIYKCTRALDKSSEEESNNSVNKSAEDQSKNRVDKSSEEESNDDDCIWGCLAAICCPLLCACIFNQQKI